MLGGKLELTLVSANCKRFGFRIEKAEVVQINPNGRSLNVTEEAIANNTKDILDKIAEIHRKQGLVVNKPKKRPVYQYGYPFKNQRRFEEFSFPQTPFNNPIFDYLQKVGANQQNNFRGGEEEAGEQVVRRKVTHQQSFSIIPMVAQPQPPPQLLMPALEAQPVARENVTKNDTASALQSTVDNIKNIVSSVPVVAVPYAPNPYYNPYYGYYSGYDQQSRYADAYVEPSRRQIQWPWQQFFPIIIKDPIMQMFNAMTSMVEYGPTATCPGKEAEEQTKKQAKSLTITPTKENSTLEVNDLKITEAPVVFTLNFKTPPLKMERKEKATKGESKRVTIKKPERIESPPERDPELGDGEIESEAEDIVLDSEIKKDDGILHNNNKKFFSKDNTGSGIFIHKIKVRKGGVAIAGPGGIATAGSGGTAIVGPNGFAYTHPDSLAIAGTGSKVIAIDPSVSLSEVVNKTRRDGSTPRQGKVVAIGPVVYYNRG